MSRDLPEGIEVSFESTVNMKERNGEHVLVSEGTGHASEDMMPVIDVNERMKWTEKDWSVEVEVATKFTERGDMFFRSAPRVLGFIKLSPT